jgi:hypothetical protein
MKSIARLFVQLGSVEQSLDVCLITLNIEILVMAPPIALHKEAITSFRTANARKA